MKQKNTKNLYFYFLLLICVNSFSQLTIDNTSYTTTQLANTILVPPVSGTSISNVNYYGVFNSGGRYQAGYFSTSGTTQTIMEFEEGVVLTTGRTNSVPEPLGNDPRATQESGTYSSCTTGEIRKSGTCGSNTPSLNNDLNVLSDGRNYFNASVLDFEFIPVEDSVSFRYIFGSEEYEDDSGFINYQCSNYNDKFAFLISGPGLSGGQGYDNDAKNIARLGNNSIVSINSVNNGTVGSSGGAPSAANCISDNPAWLQNNPSAEYFGPINGTSMNGNTKILTASQGGLTPGATYRIKLIVVDVQDGGYDSVVYLEAGSFTTESSCSAGPDETLCGATSTTLAATSPLSGTWTVVSGTGSFPDNSNINSIVNGLSIGDNVFQWSNGVESCNVTITVTNDPNAGTNGTLTVCQGTSPTDAELFAELGGSPDAGGTWTNAGLIYTYTVTATPPCTDATATVTVTEETQPNAGTNGTLTVCAGTNPTNAELFAELGGTPDAGGTWTNAGLVYTYTVTATPPCTDATATVTVTEETQPNAGTNGTLTVCQGTNPTDAELFAELGGTPDAGGTWTNAGLVYTYTVTANTPCTDATATVTVTEETQPNAGTNGTLTVCQGTSPTSAELFAELGGSPDAGGTWTNVGLVYTYTVTATPPCTDATATVTVTEDPNLIPSFNAITPICEGSNNPLPSTSTNGVTGTWTPIFDNSIVGDTNYTFTPDLGQCVDNSTPVTLTVTINSIIIPTFNVLDTICEGDILILPTTSIEGSVGVWTPTFNNNAIGETEYTFTPNAGQCANVISLVIEVLEIPNGIIVNECDGANYTLSVLDQDEEFTYSWYDSAGNLISDELSIVITSSDTYELQIANGICIVSENVNITNTFCAIPKGISPNGDGLNDTWDLSNFDIKQVKIFNRYGVELYSKDNYKNEWDGTSKGGELPSATYYYIITFNNNTNKTGWVYINR